MREFQQRRQAKTILYSKGAILILLLALLLLTRSTMELRMKYLEVKASNVEVEAERDLVRDKVRKAEEKLAFISSERGREEYLRTTYPVVEDGEEVIVVYGASTSPVVPVKQKKDISWYDRVLSLFIISEH